MKIKNFYPVCTLMRNRDDVISKIAAVKDDRLSISISGYTTDNVMRDACRSVVLRELAARLDTIDKELTALGVEV